jgi:hypothetical protein
MKRITVLFLVVVGSVGCAIPAPLSPIAEPAAGPSPASTVIPAVEADGKPLISGSTLPFPFEKEVQYDDVLGDMVLFHGKEGVTLQLSPATAQIDEQSCCYNYPSCTESSIGVLDPALVEGDVVAFYGYVPGRYPSIQTTPRAAWVMSAGADDQETGWGSLGILDTGPIEGLHVGWNELLFVVGYARIDPSAMTRQEKQELIKTSMGGMPPDEVLVEGYVEIRFFIPDLPNTGSFGNQVRLGQAAVVEDSDFRYVIDARGRNSLGETVVEAWKVSLATGEVVAYHCSGNTLSALAFDGILPIGFTDGTVLVYDVVGLPAGYIDDYFRIQREHVWPVYCPIFGPEELEAWWKIGPSGTGGDDPAESGKYVGLSASEVAILRGQCLAENSESFCLPLPFEPISLLEEQNEDEIGTLTLSGGPDGYVFVAPVEGRLGINKFVWSPPELTGLILYDRQSSVAKAVKFRLVDPESDIESIGLLYDQADDAGELDGGGFWAEGSVLPGTPVFAGAGAINLEWGHEAPASEAEHPHETSPVSLTKDDLLHDAEGRIVCILPSGQEVTEPDPEPSLASEPEVLDHSVKGPFVGLSASEVGGLRKQCLAENPNSLCLPLPVEPKKVTQILRRSEDWTFSVVEVECSPGAVIAAPLAVEFEDLSGDDQGLRVHAGEAEDGSVSFAGVVFAFYLPGGDGWNEFPLLHVSVESEGRFLCRSESSLVLQSDSCAAGTEVGNLTVESKTVSVAVGDPLLTVSDEGTAVAIHYFGGANVGADGVDRSRVDEDELLRDSAGRIVYVLPVFPQVSN